jgi:transposase-like protein
MVLGHTAILFSPNGLYRYQRFRTGTSSLPAAKKGELYVPRNVTVARLYRYLCHLCGYRWTWRTGTPYPPVTVRPDLIAKGEQKLQEEEAARRWRQWRDQGYYEYYIKPKQK